MAVLSFARVPALFLVSALGFSLLAGPEALAAPALDLPTGSVYVDVTYTPGSDSTYDIELIDIGPGYDVSSSVYDGWCVEDNGRPTHFEVELFSTYDPGMPQDVLTYQSSNIPKVMDGTVALGDAVPWDKLNYLLNHKQGSAYDVQAAIWLLIWGQSSSFALTPTAVAMVSDADAHGTGFESAPGQVAAVLLYVDGLGWEGSQETVIEVVLPPVEACPDEDGDGYSVCDRDCNDQNANVYPGAPELCDGLDNDCDGAVDEDFPADTQTDLVAVVSEQAGSMAILDSSTGLSTPLLGDNGAVMTGLNGLTTVAINPTDGLLYLATGEGDDKLYTVNRSTGVLSVVGPLTGGNNNLQGMDFAPEAAAQWGFTPGALYGVSIDSTQLCGPNCFFGIDWHTGQSQVLASLATNQVRGVSFNPITGELWAYDPGGKNLYTLRADGTLTYQFTVPGSHQQMGTGVDTSFTLAHGCNGAMYMVDIAYGVLLWIDLDTREAYWVGDFGSAVGPTGSFQIHGLDGLKMNSCGCALSPSDTVPVAPPAPAGVGETPDLTDPDGASNPDSSTPAPAADPIVTAPSDEAMPESEERNEDTERATIACSLSASSAGSSDSSGPAALLFAALLGLALRRRR